MALRYRSSRRAILVAALLGLGMFVAATVGGAGPATVGLGTAGSYAVLAGAGVTNTGPTVLDGDLGTCPTPAITGFTGPPAGIVNGATHAGDPAACQAQSDLTTAYNDAAGRAPTTTYPGPTDLGGKTLTPGVYRSPSSFAITGTLTLDGGGDPNAVFIFQAGSTLITAPNSKVVLINGAQACNVFWQVGSSATLGVGSAFAGTILALSSITANTNAAVEGRLLARNGAVTLDSDRVTVPACLPAPTSTTTTTAPSTTTTVAATSSTSTSSSTTSSSTTSSTSTSTTAPPAATTTTTTGAATSTTAVPAATTTSTTGQPATTTTTTTAPPATTSTTLASTGTTSTSTTVVAGGGLPGGGAGGGTTTSSSTTTSTSPASTTTTVAGGGAGPVEGGTTTTTTTAAIGAGGSGASGGTTSGTVAAASVAQVQATGTLALTGPPVRSWALAGALALAVGGPLVLLAGRPAPGRRPTGGSRAGRR